MKELILFRGLPGSGKTTLAESLLDIVFSADDYFIGAGGEYNFDPTKLKQAHEFCQNATRAAMHDGVDKIGVANTFTQAWEMQPYFDAAKEYGYRVHTVAVENRHMSTDVHNVPKEAKNRMNQRFQVVL